MIKSCATTSTRPLHLADPFDLGDEVDRLIHERAESALAHMVLNGEYARLEHRIFPPHSRDLARILQNLNVRTGRTTNGFGLNF